MINKIDIDRTLAYCNKKLDLNFKGDEYFYSCLPLCVVDTVFSINAKYEAVKNTITRVCTNLDVNEIGNIKRSIPEIESQISVSEYLDKIFSLTSLELAEKVYGNRQRTSSTNGILKAEAVSQFLGILQKYEVEYYQDIKKIASNTDFEVDIKSIKGQGSGVSLKYFFMLTGSTDLIKPDRMIIRFLEAATGKTISAEGCQELLTAVSDILVLEYPFMTPRLLDHQIWNFQRDSRNVEINNNDDENFYERRMDIIFGKGSMWKHRTMRTVLHPASHEWTETTIEKKIEILRKVVENQENLQELIFDYKQRYKEQNRTDIANSVEDALLILLNYELQNNLIKQNTEESN
jgi:hypothetical protein